MAHRFIPGSSAERESISQEQSILKNSTSRRFFLRSSLAGAAIVVPASLVAACGGGGQTSGTPSGSTPGSTSTTGTSQTLALTTLSDSKMPFTEIMNDENAHVKFLQDALKSAARPKPTFQKIEQTDIQSFATVSQALENTGVGAYLMAAPAVTDKSILAAAGSILTIEARHAGFLDALLQMPLSANGAFDKPLTQAQIVTAATPFIASLNGGTDPSAPLKNDIDILNFALLLEFLEAEFYSINVPKFFK